jgi:hypothetical protein
MWQCCECCGGVQPICFYQTVTTTRMGTASTLALQQGITTQDIQSTRHSINNCLVVAPTHMPVYPMRPSTVPLPVNCVHAPAIAATLHHGLVFVRAGKLLMLTGRVLLLPLLYWQTLCSGPGKLCAVRTTAASQANLRVKHTSGRFSCRQRDIVYGVA